MSGRRTARLISFVAAAGSVGVAATLSRVCPGTCTSCASCATTLVPMGTAAGAVGLALAGSAVARRRERRAGADR